MIAIQLGCIIALLFLGWLGIRRKWKVFGWAVFGLVALATVGSIAFLLMISYAFGETCRTVKEWRVDEYHLVRQECLGWAGPPYYPVHLVLHGDRISTTTSWTDSCTITFIIDRSDTLHFNVCELKLDGTAH
ncbi:MAG: hypothetical protein IPM49_17200 [Flavobacteriales bacterium]|nr:hypothetical protein [Flavobacteriales bacterium]